MAILTLTSDLGDRNHYAAALKAGIFSRVPHVSLVDITHQVEPFNIMEAAFLLRSVYSRFPDGTVHLVAVDPEGGVRPGVIMAHQGQFFVAADNGVLSLVRNSDAFESWSITSRDLQPDPRYRAFPAMTHLVPAACHLVSGGRPDEIAEKQRMKELLWIEPVYSENSLRGTVVHIDRFGNAITNLNKEEFLRIKGDRSFQLFFRKLKLQRIVNTYSDVPRGDALALFGESGYLEIAIREGSATQLLGFQCHDMLTIEFYG